MIQDYVVAGVQTVFCFNLLPMVWSTAGKHTPLLSSLSTALGMLVMAVAFYTVPLVYSAITSLVVAITWTVLAYQRWRFLRAARNG